MDALNLYADDALEAERVAASPESGMEIYKADYKFLSSREKDGKYLVYSIVITCDPGQNYPWRIKISNCYAPINQTLYLEVLLALFCGLRKGEILGLQFSDFDEKAKF